MTLFENKVSQVKGSYIRNLNNILKNIVFVDNTNKAIQSIKKIISECTSLSEKTKQCIKGVCFLEKN